MARSHWVFLFAFFTRSAEVLRGEMSSCNQTWTVALLEGTCVTVQPHTEGGPGAVQDKDCSALLQQLWCGARLCGAVTGLSHMQLVE